MNNADIKQNSNPKMLACKCKISTLFYITCSKKGLRYKMPYRCKNAQATEEEKASSFLKILCQKENTH